MFAVVLGVCLACDRGDQMTSNLPCPFFLLSPWALHTASCLGRSFALRCLWQLGFSKSHFSLSGPGDSYALLPPIASFHLQRTQRQAYLVRLRSQMPKADSSYCWLFLSCLLMSEILTILINPIKARANQELTRWIRNFRITLQCQNLLIACLGQKCMAVLKFLTRYNFSLIKACVAEKKKKTTYICFKTLT